jgi:hypothetical protein
MSGWRSRRVWASIAPAAAAFVVAPAATNAQETRESSPSHASSTQPTHAVRIPLIREGSYIVEQRGVLVRPPSSPLWRFQLQGGDSRQPAPQLSVLPCALLAEMERIATSMPQQQVVFEMTGQVFLYRSRNYLLPTHAPELVGYDDPVAPAQTQPQLPDAPAAADPGSDTAPAGAESADDVERQLERAIGSLPRSAGARGEGGASPEETARLAPEGTVVAARRGHITRDSSGTWVFVLDADARGVADPPMVLLPCLLLEKIEEYARTSPANAPAIMSGRAFVYNGRNYLLPSVYRVPEETSRLMP